VFVHAMLKGRAVTEYANGTISQQIRRAWDHILALSISCLGKKVMAS
jgi:hypothetical protein